MTTVAEAFGHGQPRLSPAHPKLVFNACIGIELEIEEVNHINIPLWDCKEDGSLRNGCEMVCSEPYSGERLYQAIELLSEGVGASNANGTWRCSTHVHLDVRDCDVPQLKKIILAWAFYEKMMFKCSGFHRYRSNFCPAFAVVQGQVFNVASAFNQNNSRFFNALATTWDKYTSLNLLPLRDFGSVEFRISEPKWKRSNVLNLVNRFLMLKKLAVENDAMNPQEFVDYLKEQSFAPMMNFLPLDYEMDQSDLDLGYQIANDIINVRSTGVQLVQRIREAEVSEDGSALIPVQDLGHWGPYQSYLQANNRNLWNTLRENFPELQDRNPIMSENRIREYCAALRETRGEVDDSNIYRLLPDGYEQDLQRYLRDV